MSAHPLGDFGREWWLEVVTRTTSAAASRLAHVLIDVAYTQKSTTVRAGQRHLRDGTKLSNWNLSRARDELISAGLLRCRVLGRGRNRYTEYELVLEPGAGLKRTEPGAGLKRRPSLEPASEPACEPASEPGAGSTVRSVPVLTNSVSRSKDQPRPDDLNFEELVESVAEPNRDVHGAILPGLSDERRAELEGQLDNPFAAELLEVDDRLKANASSATTEPVDDELAVNSRGELVSLRCECGYLAGNLGGLEAHRRACRGAKAVAR